MNFDERPLIVFWEVTRACPLSCKHCRAEAITSPLPGELNKEEGFRLLEEIASFGSPKPLTVFTGGDPISREDLLDLLEYARSLGLRTALAPAVSEKLFKVMDELPRLIDAVSISLDGARAETHDEIRRERGSYEMTLKALRELSGRGVRVQINTVVLKENVMELPELLKLVLELGVSAWELFFLVKVGRGIDVEDLTPQEYEDVMNFLYDASHYVTVRTVEAPFFRRVVLERSRGISRAGELYKLLREKMEELVGRPRGEPKAHTLGTRDGKGVIFVSYDGTVFPSGFMPYPLGNIRRSSLVSIYRESPLLKAIRESKFKGRCGVCKYKDLCGGSRARAYATFGDPLAEDPACPYNPVEEGL